LYNTLSLSFGPFIFIFIYFFIKHNNEAIYLVWKFN